MFQVWESSRVPRKLQEAVEFNKDGRSIPKDPGPSVSSARAPRNFKQTHFLQEVLYPIHVAAQDRAWDPCPGF